MSEIIKIIDKRETQKEKQRKKQTDKTNKDRKEQGGTEAII